MRRSVRFWLPVVGAMIGCDGGGDGGTGPGPAATRLTLAAQPAEAQTMVALNPQPVVQATDANGRPARAAVTVTAEVVSGNGAVVSGGTATTDANGRAAFSNLTLGAVSGRAGPVTLRFSAPGLDPVTAVVDLRCSLLPIQVGQTVNRALTSGDCTFSDGSFINVFELTTSQQVTPVQLTQDGTFRSFLLFRGPNEPRFYWGEWAGTTSNRVSYKALLPAGRNRIVATSFAPGVTGNYSLSVASASEDVSCEIAYAGSPVTTAQRLAAGDCEGSGFFADFFFVGLPRGATITASMTSQAFTPRIALAEDATDTQVATGSGQGSAGIVFTNNSSFDQLYYIRASSATAGGTGAYTLNISIAYPTTSSVAPAASAARAQSVAGLSDVARHGWSASRTRGSRRQ